MYATSAVKSLKAQTNYETRIICNIFGAWWFIWCPEQFCINLVPHEKLNYDITDVLSNAHVSYFLIMKISTN